MTESLKNLHKQLPPDPGLRPGVDVGGAEIITAGFTELIRVIGNGKTLTPGELHRVQSQRAANQSDASKI